ncbi:MAG: phenylalanine--tRNA ligase subunit beta [Candidatus Tagabacteria bacterium CG_4_10_14_0_2_um_filter_40_13]|uniref:Phenylalanine--tRNA ligase beta subunit n=1 Tax=Candidatus Tagabacteria bacterium CG03_land_8_20_14_0_80_41_22 TaxID=1975020 RepID=A0A2M7B9F8_9BACT|nr:MAG: phenylalanine--tRNA ligase subunit beta [Candidatus Tagabacteria bacterium CG11_big_fil_rev_8_21_14_0_20_41_11]PIU99757.1 MAG: phenylalanine--tRNA ligase subunit beta [Candidatus Tagabacteria bacterium CG03_land_8_20_14_0_80_41_22]PIZ56271.1 MAG: phenylalanine--tRNA ligase subunit beta [Candidatus Tagabacteria bacterium CG_4_10_14_0_2_um_filter_40_13]
MLFSYNWLQSFFDKKLPKPEKLAEVLTSHSFETKVLKEVGLPSGGKDIVLDIDVLPNRAHDCFSHLGIAREISVVCNIPLKIQPQQKLAIEKRKAEEFLKLDVQESDFCRRYIAGIMLGIKVGPSPSWMQERLIVLGQKPINNIVDSANYVMFELGQPLHAFDMDKLNPAKIVVRRAKEGEQIITLDNKEYKLDKSMLVIADSSDPIAIAGIKGGKKKEIDAKTKNIIIESANFEPINIRKTSQKLGLRTGASVGFENEISPALAADAIERVMALISETAGGKIVSEKIDFYPKKFKPSRISFGFKDVASLLGVKIPEKKALSILNRLRLEPKKEKGEITVMCPSERMDLARKEDVIEEIARIYGYDKIPAEIPEGVLMPVRRNDNYFYGNVIRDILVGAGFSEVYNYSFAKIGQIEIENPIAMDKKYLRMDLWNGLRMNAAQNLKYFDEIKIFEIGKIFRKAHERIIEKNKLAGVVVYKDNKKNTDVFFEIKGVIDALLSGLGISDFWFDNSPEPPINRVEIKIGNDGIGFIMSPNTFEIDLEELIRLATEEIEYRPVSKYPAMIRDIAVLVPPSTKVINVLDVIENTAGKLLIDTDLFDIYKGDELGANRKNLAFHLIFQSSEKTLSDKEVNVLIDKIIKAIEGNSDWEVRK